MWYIYRVTARKKPGKIIAKIPAAGVFLAAIFPGGFLAATLYKVLSFNRREKNNLIGLSNRK